MKISTIFRSGMMMLAALMISTFAFAQESDKDPNVELPTLTQQGTIEDQFDVQFNHAMATAAPGAVSTAGAAWIPADTSFWITRWNADSIFRVDMNGMPIERFVLPVTGARSLTWDGTNIWVGNATTTITAINPVTRAVVTTVAVPEAARYLSYDANANSGAGGFWLGNFNTDVYLVDMAGTTLTTISTANLPAARYGAAVDPYTMGGPNVWFFHQSDAATGAMAVLYNVPSSSIVRTVDVNAALGTSAVDLAGGLFITDQLAATPTLGGVVQGSAIFGLQLLDTVDITIEVNTANITPDATGIYVGGGNGFGGPSDNLMTDPDGDGIYTITVQRTAGFESHYTFINGNSGWGAKEILAGLPCSDPNNFNDRWMPAVFSDTTFKACFGTCDSDGSCTAPPADINVTFNINMDSAPDSIKNNFTTVHVFGSFNGWNNALNPLTDNGDGTWTTTVALSSQQDSFEYKFITDVGEEVFVVGAPCTITSGQFINRIGAVVDSIQPMFCWSVCSSCLSSVGGLNVDENLFELHPSLVNSYTNLTFKDEAINQDKTVIVYNSVGQIVFNARVNNENTYRIETANYANGLYFVSVKTDNVIMTKKFVVSK